MEVVHLHKTNKTNYVTMEDPVIELCIPDICRHDPALPVHIEYTSSAKVTAQTGKHSDKDAVILRSYPNPIALHTVQANEKHCNGSYAAIAEGIGNHGEEERLTPTRNNQSKTSYTLDDDKSCHSVKGIGNSAEGTGISESEGTGISKEEGTGISEAEGKGFSEGEGQCRKSNAPQTIEDQILKMDKLLIENSQPLIDCRAHTVHTKSSPLSIPIDIKTDTMTGVLSTNECSERNGIYPSTTADTHLTKSCVPSTNDVSLKNIQASSSCALSTDLIHSQQTNGTANGEQLTASCVQSLNDTQNTKTSVHAFDPDQQTIDVARQSSFSDEKLSFVTSQAFLARQNSIRLVSQSPRMLRRGTPITEFDRKWALEQCEVCMPVHSHFYMCKVTCFKFVKRTNSHLNLNSNFFKELF